MEEIVFEKRSEIVIKAVTEAARPITLIYEHSDVLEPHRTE